MSTPFLPALDTEIAELEAKLATDPTYVKLQKLRETRRLYQDEVLADVPGAVVVRRRFRPRPVTSTRQRALKAAALAIKGKKTPTKTSEIAQILEDQSIQIGGANPLNNLSAMLSNSPQFRSHGRDGWVLVEPNGITDAEAAGVSAPAASNRDLLDQQVNPAPQERG